MNKIEKYFKIIKNNTNFINNWWCLIAAYAIYLKAKEEWIAVTITQLATHYYNYLISHNIRFMEWKEKTAQSSNHYVIKYNNKYYDADWEWVDFEWYEILDIKENIDKFCLSAINNPRADWNKKYDRKQNKIISEKLWLSNTDFEKIKLI